MCFNTRNQHGRGYEFLHIPNVEEFFETILDHFWNALLIFALKKRLDNFVVWRAVGSGNLYSHSCCLG